MENPTIETIPAHVSNYTPGRGGRRIRAITVHHMAAVWTARRCGESFQQAERDASSHYGIGYDGEIAQYVEEKDTAWTNGNWDSNLESVTIECANSAMGSPWPVSEKTLDSLVWLLAELARRHGLAPLVPGVNLTWHRMFEATACPGEYLLSRMEEIAARANARLSGEEKTESLGLSYRVYTDRWLPPVTGFNTDDGENGYAGVLGEEITGLFAVPSRGALYYQAHVRGGTWLPTVKNGEDYAGILGQSVDAIALRGEGFDPLYRVHTREDGWLPPVTGFDASDAENGYAGILGHAIDGIAIRLIARPEKDVPPALSTEEAETIPAEELPPEEVPEEVLETPPTEERPAEAFPTEESEAEEELEEVKNLFFQLLKKLFSFLVGLFTRKK